MSCEVGLLLLEWFLREEVLLQGRLALGILLGVVCYFLEGVLLLLDVDNWLFVEFVMIESSG